MHIPGRVLPSPSHWQYITVTLPTGPYHLLKNDHHHSKPEEIGFYYYNNANLFFSTIHVCEHGNAGIEEAESATSRRTGEERGWEH